MAVFLAFLAGFGLSGIAQDARPWPHEGSDLTPDPDVTYGTLDNGMRYILLFNDTPPGQASLKLHFNTGSLNEADDQRGVAHFLEHMAFNGSANVPEGEMIKILERYGLAFGPDTNAFTSFDQTAYLLELPDTRDELVDQALFLMRETAGNLTLDPEAIDRERGVVLSEYRARNTPGFRFAKQLYDFIAPETRVAERFPIGTPESISGFGADRVRDYYERYYRPERATLVLVGDLDLERAEAKIRDLFADWQAATPADPDPDYGTVSASPEVVVDHRYDPELQPQILLDFVVASDPEPDTRQNRFNDLLRDLGNAIVSRRLATIARSADGVINGGSVSHSRLFEMGEQTTVFISSEPQNWAEALGLAVKEIRRPGQFGFTQAELDEQLANVRTSLENAVKSAETRTSAALAEGLMASQFSKRVFTDPETDLALFNALEDKITPEAVLEAFRAQLLSGQPRVTVAGPIELEDPDQQIMAAVAAGAQAQLEPPAEKQQVPWAYEDFGEPGQVATRNDVGDPDYTKVVFDNNVMLNLKKTDFEDNVIRAAIRIDGGDLALIGAEDAALSLLISYGLPAGGLGAHSSDDIQRLLAGRSVGGSFSVQTDAYGASAATTPDDLLLQLQLWAAYMTDPGYRPEGEAQFKRLFSTVYDAQESTPGGVINTRVGRIIRSGDPRFGLPPLEDLLATDFDQVRTKLADPFANAAIEITLVGDLDVEAAIDAVARTFGALPERRAEPELHEEGRKLEFTEPGSVTLPHKGPADQALVRLYWPTTDLSDPMVSRRLDLLFGIFDLRMTEEVREALGATYSGQVANTESAIFPGFGYGFAGADVSVDDIDEIVGVIEGIAKRLAEGTISEDELTRARNPLLEGIEEQRTNNGFWLSMLSTAQTRPDLIEYQWDAAEDYKSITVEELNDVARRFLKPETAFTVKILPEEAISE